MIKKPKCGIEELPDGGFVLNFGGLNRPLRLEKPELKVPGAVSNVLGPDGNPVGKNPSLIRPSDAECAQVGASKKD